MNSHLSPAQAVTTVKVRRLYHQKYREEWERFPSFAPWLCRGDDGYSAHCKICDANVLARLASIKQHNNAVKHQKAMQSYNPGLKIENMKTENLKNESSKPVPQKAVIVKPKPKIKRIKVEKIDPTSPVPPPEMDMELDNCSNDSILEDLLGNEDDIEPEYLHSVGEQVINIKPETIHEFKIDETNEENFEDDNIISEFDLFGKSLSLQLNHMELEDALLCQERLQVVLTEFRLKILKRKAKRSF
ncbi:uncharacterized protein LOC117566129 [Drosophila albomicans]|uniref:Uncharacterized protein LOC117566129 n=1 Tax=Drosophila albomicans TaxID=7291 RepID=A0A6P8WCW6_DROAB|nr:uncharacterized protein LOC117566129 [Drosophila albomicans]